MITKMTQVKLVREEIDMQAETVVWLPADKRIRKGLVLRLKGEKDWWTIDEVYTTQDRTTLRDDWHVGGL